MHFGNSGIKNPGHDSDLLSSFYSLLDSRPDNLDYFIITGDCTTNGSSRNSELFSDFLAKIKPKAKKVLIVPGNHDSWSGGNFITIQLKNLCRFFVQLFSNKEDRRSIHLDKFLPHDFKKNPYHFEVIQWASKRILFMLIDSTYRSKYAIAQGVFPSKAQLSSAWDYLNNENGNYDVLALMLHHHIIRYFEPINSNASFIRHELTMRLLNSTDAKEFIKRSNTKLIFHGHKHISANEVMLTNDAQATFCPAPAAFLSGIKPGHLECVGFNVMRNIGQRVYLSNVKFESGYQCFEITQLKL